MTSRAEHGGERSNGNFPGGPVFGRLLLQTAQKLRGSRSLTLLPEILDDPFKSPEEVRRDQFQRLSDLLAHAEQHVPYYREMFRSLGITSRDVRNLSDFAQLPILTKDIIRERQSDLIREDKPRETLLPHHSGGSTGVPLTFYREREYMDASDAGTFRNLMQCGWAPGEMIAFFWGGNEKLYAMSRLEFEARQQLRRMYQFDPFHSSRDEMAKWLKRWRRLRPTVALGYASTIARFANFIQNSGQHTEPLRGVFTTAEKLYQPQRETIARVFGCPVFDLYGSSEVQNIAGECSRGRMHINADFVVLESDRKSNGVAPFLITSLWNRTMPFIRYRNEDCGELLNEICDCGNNFPLMRLDIARVSDNFVMPSGRVVHGEFFTHLMYGSEGILNFQFHQTSRNHLMLWIVTGPGDKSARDKSVAAAVAQVKALEPESEIVVEVRETNEIPLSNAGKHRFTRTDVHAEASHETSTN